MTVESPRNIKPASQLISHEGAPDLDQVNAYRSAIHRGERLDPILVIKEGSKYGVEDGKHRLAAYLAEGIQDIPVKIIRRFTKDRRGRFTGSK